MQSNLVNSPPARLIYASVPCAASPAPVQGTRALAKCGTLYS